MKALFKIPLLAIICTILLSCQKETISPRDYPRLMTLPVFEVSPSGATYKAEIIYRGPYEVINYGFAWGESSLPTINHNQRVIYTENIQDEFFSARIESALRENTLYYVRSFIKTESHLVYGESVKFTSKGSSGAVLTEFSPKTAQINDTITLKGSGFGSLYSKVKVYFGKHEASVITVSNNELKALVPGSLNTTSSPVTVAVEGISKTYDELFSLY